MGPRSLFRRLLLSFSGLLLVLWLSLIALTVWSARNLGLDAVAHDLHGTAHELLIGAIELSDRPAAIERVVQAIEREADATMTELGSFGSITRIQVWHGATVVYPSQRLPLLLPTSSGSSYVDVPGEAPWVAWVETDAHSGMTVRVASQHPAAVILRPNTLAYMLLPLVICAPLLLLPTWFVTRLGLRPLRDIGAAIAMRQDASLAPLAPSRYRELAPIVDAINQLLARLETRLSQEQAFLADAAHELKTPLAVIQVNAESLAASPDPVRQAEARKGLRQGLARAVHAIHQLLALTRSGADHAQHSFASFALAAFVRERIAFLAGPALLRRIELEFDVEADGQVLLEPESAAAMIDNVIDNAIKYSPDGASVQLLLTRSAGQFLLSISDRGPGIAPEWRDRVFERFVRIPGQDQPGSGLGLAIVERAARAHRATVTMADGPDGQGLCVTLHFPLAPPGAPAVQ